jgi:hypothetical protein
VSVFDSDHARLIAIDRFLYTLAYGENTHILLEDRKSLERPAALEKIRVEQEAANQAAVAATSVPAIEDDDVVIIDAAGQEPGAVLPKVKKIPLPLHFRTTFLSLRPPSTFEQFLGQVKAKWAPRPSHATIEGVTFTVGTDWIIRMGFIQAGTSQKGIMLEVSVQFCYWFAPWNNPSHLDRVSAYADVPSDNRWPTSYHLGGICRVNSTPVSCRLYIPSYALLGTTVV